MTLDEYLEVERQFEDTNCDKMKSLMSGLSVLNVGYDPGDFYYAPVFAEERVIYCGARKLNSMEAPEVTYLISIGWRWNQNRYCWYLNLFGGW